MGIIGKAKDNATNSLLIVGREKSGKSTYALRRLRDAGIPDDQILFLSTDNQNAIAGSEVDFASIRKSEDVQEVISEVIQAATKGKKYGAIVFDGLSAYIGVALRSINPGQPTQQNWGEMGRIVETQIVTLMDLSPIFIGTALVAADETGQPELSFNRDAYKRVVPMFAATHYCYANTGTGEAVYAVQTNSTLALKFIKVKEAAPAPKK